MAKAHSASPFRIRFANAFGVLGYLSTVIQWLWAIIVVGYPLFSRENLSLFLPEKTTEIAAQPMDYGAFSPIVTVIAVVFTVCVLVLTLLVLWRLPATIGKKGKLVTHRAAEVVVPVVTHKRLNKSQKRKLIVRISWWVKSLLVLLPLCALLFSSSTTGLEANVILATGCIMAALSAIYFACQYGLSRILKVPTESLW